MFDLKPALWLEEREVLDVDERDESAPRLFGVYLTQIINIYLAQRHPRIMIQSQCINSTGSLFFGVIIQDNYQRHKERYKLQIAECQEYAMRQSRSIQSENRIPPINESESHKLLSPTLQLSPQLSSVSGS